MAVNSASSTIRLMGMSSGLDTDAIIQQTLKLHQLKIDKQNRAKTLLEWKQSSLNSIKDDVTNFRRTFLSALSTKNMRTSSVYNSSVAEVSGKNSGAVSVATTVESSLGSLTIDKVESLAKGASVSSQGDASETGNGFSSSTKLGNMTFAGGQKLNFDDTTGDATLKINGHDITVNKDDTLDDMLKKINNSDAGVTMSYDRLSDKFTLESKTIGSKKEDLTFSDDLKVFGFDSSNVEDGSMAVVYINGQRVERDSNTIDYRGLKITLNETTQDGDEPTQVTVKRDASKAVETIKEFVNTYNGLIEKLEGLLKERKTSAEATYTPLTDEEKEAMTEKQIETWEAIAKKGILRNDSGIQNMVTSLRSALFDAVEGAGLSPSAIGLSTGSYFDGKGGQITLDEDKLKAALEKDPEQVANIFVAVGSGTDAEKYKGNGLLNRMDKIMGDYLNGSQKTSIKNLEDALRRANEQIDVIQTKMRKEEEALYKKYAAMETALSKIQSQGDWLTAMLNGG